MKLLDFSKMAARMSAKEKEHYQEGDLGPGVPTRKITPLPTVKEPKHWEFSAHPHLAERAGSHIDIRLGNPETGIAHSFVLPKRTELPKPGEAARVIPTFDHSIPYMNYWGEISTRYGKGTVEKGRRTTAEVYHADPSDQPGTKARFNLYEGPNPEEFSIRKDNSGKWFIHNKTQTRERRPDIPSTKPSLKEVDPDEIDPTDLNQAMMPKLDGAHGILDLQAGRAPRLFSYREAKVSPTGLIEHTHKVPELLKTKVPKELDRTLARVEIVGVDKNGKAIEPEVIGGLLNSKVWDSRRKQAELGVKLQVFPHGLVQYKGKSMEEAPYSEQLKVLKKIEKAFEPAWVPEMATTPKEKIDLLNRIKAGKHPLTGEGVVLVEPNSPGVPIKAKFNPDFDVYVRDVHPAISGKTGKPHERAGAISYSWTPDGPIVGQLGGFTHDEARNMLKNPDQYVGRVAKVKARKVFKNGDELGALFQPRFKEWHLDKGEIEKELPERAKQASIKEALLSPVTKGMLYGGGIGLGYGGLTGYFTPGPKKHRERRALINALAYGTLGGVFGREIGRLGAFRAHPGFRGAPRSVPRPSWMANVKTKQEAKELFHREALKHHPDRGGSTEAMQRLNTEWQSFKKSPEFEKLAAAFLQELEKISKAGEATGLLARLFRRGTKPTVQAAPVKPSLPTATKVKAAPRQPSLEELKAEYQRAIDKQRLIDVQAGSRPRVSAGRAPTSMGRPAFSKDPVGRQHSAPWD